MWGYAIEGRGGTKLYKSREDCSFERLQDREGNLGVTLCSIQKDRGNKRSIRHISSVQVPRRDNLQAVQYKDREVKAINIEDREG